MASTIKNTLYDHFAPRDYDQILAIFGNMDFLTLRVFLDQEHDRSKPVNLLRDICLGLRDVGEILARYSKIEQMGVELIGVSLQLYDYSEYLLEDQESLTLMEMIVQEQYLFFKNAKNIPLDGYDAHLRQAMYDNIAHLLRRLPTNHHPEYFTS